VVKVGILCYVIICITYVIRTDWFSLSVREQNIRNLAFEIALEIRSLKNDNKSNHDYKSPDSMYW